MTRFRSSRIVLGLLLAFVAIGGALYTQAEAQEQQTKVDVKGTLNGGDTLLNPVWSEAAKPESNRWTFRQPTATVGQEAKVLTAYLPRELAVVAFGDTAAASGTVTVHVSGGRTTPSTIVIGPEQNVQFVNDDPFPHKLFDVGKVQNGLGPEEQKPRAQRTWKPPGPGTYEIRDELSPSVRAWVVVEPKVVAATLPTIKNEYLLKLLPGQYQVQAFHAGKKVGTALEVEVRNAPATQTVSNPLVLGASKDEKKDKDKKEEKK